MGILAQHRSDPGHLHHQPLEDLVTIEGFLREKLAMPFGQPDQDRPGLPERLPERRILDHRHLAHGIEFAEFRRELLAVEQRDMLENVGKRQLLEHDRHFDHVWAHHAVKRNRGMFGHLPSAFGKELAHRAPERGRHEAVERPVEPSAGRACAAVDVQRRTGDRSR